MGEEQGWRKNFTERELQEMAFDHYYTRMFNHGTDGHLERTIIAKLVELLDGVATAHGNEAIPPLENFERVVTQPSQ